MRSELRPLQVEAIASLRQALASGSRRPMVQAPTGWGKTILAAAIVDMALAKGNRVVFCAPAVSLIDQTVEKFYSEGITDVGVIQADHPLTDWSKPVQVASIQTLERRDRPECDLVIVDEAHKVHRTVVRWMNEPAFRRVPFIGLSATPWAKGLGRIYDRLIVAGTTKLLIEQGLLAPFKVFAPAHPDLKGVKITGGDYNLGQLSEAMNSRTLVADIVSTWLRLGEDRQTLCFGVDRAHAKTIQQDFIAAGVTCEYIDAFTPPWERESIRRRFEAGDVRIVSSVGCLTTGVDWDVRCIIMARPTKSEMLFVQMVGRGLRTADGKDDLIILDHADNHTELGFATDIHYDHLDQGKRTRASRASQVRKPIPKECAHCTFLMPVGTRVCPNCLQERATFSDVEVLEGQLAAMPKRGVRSGPAPKEEPSMNTKQRWYSSLLGIAAERGYKPGWAARQYKEKFGVWPANQLTYCPIAPDPEVRSWVKSRMIRYAMGKKKAKTLFAGVA